MSAIPIKLQCPCGQRYSFEAEAVNGKLTAPVACPVCGMSGTSLAEQTLAQMTPEPVPAVEFKPSHRIANRVAQAKYTPVARPLTDDPRRRDFIEAKQNIARAASCAFLLAGVGLVLGILTLFGISLFEIKLWIFGDALLLCALGFGLVRRSRTCAIMAFIYNLIPFILYFGEIGLIGLLIKGFCIYAFGTGISGAFTYHRLKHNFESQYQPVS
jgi:hypothetical protein